ncbi:MAG: FIST N-terminal domain-containing protein [Xanthobacteraceae bacterium]
MRVEQIFWTKPSGWQRSSHGSDKVDLAFYFGTRQSLADGTRYEEIRKMFPESRVIGCSTGGQIRDDDVSDDEVAGVALGFDATPIKTAYEPILHSGESRACGEAIGRKLQAPDLAGIFVLSDGLNVNGSELVAGLTEIVGKVVSLTGGLAGDGAQFSETLVGCDCAPRSGMVAAVGFYGSAVRIGHGSAGGWDVFGPRRRITRSKGNVLLELDGELALDLYERYLGEDEAKGLPGTGLLFPLQIHDPKQPDHEVVRTILSIDRQGRSMTFAGDLPEGWSAQLMRGNFDRLAAGAADAARQARAGISECKDGDAVALLVSCIGRRLLMGQRATDEVEAAGIELGSKISRLGFYSYGEISPHAASGICELHNQTMTVTTIAEAA